MNKDSYNLLIEVNNHMNKNPSYPGDWFEKFYNHINKNGYNFSSIDDMIIEIGKAFRNVDENWCKKNIDGYIHSETNKDTILSKGRVTYDEYKEPVDFWKRFLSQMLIYRYG